jgi:hypothetical protein
MSFLLQKDELFPIAPQQKAKNQQKISESEKNFWESNLSELSQRIVIGQSDETLGAEMDDNEVLENGDGVEENKADVDEESEAAASQEVGFWYHWIFFCVCLKRWWCAQPKNKSQFPVAVRNLVDFGATVAFIFVNLCNSFLSKFPLIRRIFPFLCVSPQIAPSKSIMKHDSKLFRLSCPCTDCLQHRETVIQLFLEDFEYNTLWERLQLLIRKFYDLIPE